MENGPQTFGGKPCALATASGTGGFSATRGTAGVGSSFMQVPAPAVDRGPSTSTSHLHHPPAPGPSSFAYMNTRADCRFVQPGAAGASSSYDEQYKSYRSASALSFNSMELSTGHEAGHHRMDFGGPMRYSGSMGGATAAAVMYGAAASNHQATQQHLSCLNYPSCANPASYPFGISGKIISLTVFHTNFLEIDQYCINSCQRALKMNISIYHLDQEAICFELHANRKFWQKFCKV